MFALKIARSCLLLSGLFYLSAFVLGMTEVIGPGLAIVATAFAGLIPIRRRLDSPGDSQISRSMIEDGNRGGCHGAGYCGADGLYGRGGSRACEASEGRCAGAQAP